MEEKFLKPKIIIREKINLEDISSKGFETLKEWNKEIDSIRKLIINLGYETINSSIIWPRDTYNFVNNTTITDDEYGFLGIGGMTIIGNDFILLSTALFNSKFSKDKEIFDKYFQKLFPKHQFYFIHPMLKDNGELYNNNQHLDLSIGIIPSLNYLSIDNKHYKQNKQTINYIQKKHKINLDIISTTENERKLYGNNYLVIEEPFQTPIVISNSLTLTINEKLKKQKIELYHPEKEIKYSPKQGGSIRCLTNLVWTQKQIKYLNLIQEKILAKSLGL